MRKVEILMLQAVLKRVRSTCSANTKVEVVKDGFCSIIYVYLHGNCIFKMKYDNKRSKELSYIYPYDGPFAGSQVTKSRIKALKTKWECYSGGIVE